MAKVFLWLRIKRKNMPKILVIVVPRHGVKFIVDFVFNLFNAVQSLSGAFVFFQSRRNCFSCAGSDTAQDGSTGSFGRIDDKF